VVTGKPIGIGGIPGRVKATGHGVAHIASLAIDLDGARCLVSGFGNVGQFAATGAESCGAAVSAIIDPYLGGVLLNPAGISCAELANFLATNGRSATSFVEFAESFEGYEVIDVGELLHVLDSLPVDVFLPCAAPQSIHSDFAAALVSAGVKIVVEGANSPLTPSAELVFAAAATQIVPDVLANAGGVVCSYLEMSKAASMTLPTETETLANVSSILTDAWTRTTEYNRRYNLGNNLRLTADTVAVADIAAVHTLRGIF
jgi:glutamate dehydrogenase/leucine dehydrogenase